MEPSAIAQARARLVKAEKALASFEAATTLEDAEEAWSDFLLAASTIYSKLEQGSKGHNRSAPWFGKKKKERRDDDLLRYLHFARNSDEHGIQRVSATTGPNFRGDGRAMRFNEREYVKMQKVNRQSGEPEGPLIDGVLAGPTLKPVRATDSRYGDYCDPPEIHLGEAIKYCSFVDGLAKAAIPYLRQLIEEAQELADSPSEGTTR